MLQKCNILFVSNFVDIVHSDELVFLNEVTIILSDSLNVQQSISKIFEIFNTTFNINKSILIKYNEFGNDSFVSFLWLSAEMESVFESLEKCCKV